MIAQTLRNFNLFVDGRGYQGKVQELTLPKLTLKTEEFRAGGTDMPVEYDLGMEKMEAEFTLAEYSPEIIKLFGTTINPLGYPLLSFRGALRDSVGITSAVKVEMRGQIKSIEKDNWKSGEASNMKCMLAVHYYKYSHNDEVLVEVDPQNMLRVINGIDQLALERAALGL